MVTILSLPFLSTFVSSFSIEICSPKFAAKDFSGLFAHLSIF